jgi:hypothetical protein
LSVSSCDFSPLGLVSVNGRADLLPMALAGGDDGEEVDWTSPVDEESEVEERMRAADARWSWRSRIENVASDARCEAPRETGRATGRSDRQKEEKMRRRRRSR